MNKLFHKLSILSLSIISFSNIQAQTLDSDTSSLNVSEFKFPSLEVVIDSVLNRSAMMSFRKNNIGVKESTLASERIYWTRNIGIQADTRYGNLSNFATSEDGVSNTAALTTAKQFNYSFGFYLKIPIFDVINRKNQIKVAKYEVNAAKDMVEFEKEELRKTVIQLYQDLILKQKLLQIKSKRLGAGKVNLEMVEKEFRKGVIEISEYVIISELVSKMESEYETAMSDFIIAKQLLEDMAGFVFRLTLSN
jgi:outer membrane protein TolC